ncbi:GTPase [Actinobaculum suis]|uniref:GTPase n=2 Tax=Actinobaculum suis TaxID=1657 RepID=A0AAW9HSC7_9ACTO|nr:GTPase [Actinobaculum suis]MDY5153968.1 GTPase [Actinobaculum suis]
MMYRRDFAKLVERTMTALEGARLPLSMPGSEEVGEARIQLLTRLGSRVLPKLRQSDTPAVIVFGGSSGAGKSTLFNSLLGAEYSQASVLRPTTRTPVIAVHPENVEAMQDHAVTKTGNLVVTEGAVPGAVLVDAPDLDSVDADNRELSRRLLDAADLWIFVTTASRYGDLVSWDILTEAHARGTTIAVVLNRVREEALRDVRRDLVARLNSAGLGNAPLLTVPDAGPHEGLLPEEIVTELRAFFESIGAAGYSEALVERSNALMLPQTADTLERIAAAVEAQAQMIEALQQRAQDATASICEELASLASHGRFGQGAPTTTWLTHASAGGALAGVNPNNRPNLLQRRRSGERDQAVTEVFDGVVRSLRTTLSRALTSAEGAVQAAWGQGIADTTQILAQAQAQSDRPAVIAKAIYEWMGDLKNLITTQNSKGWFGAAGTASLLGAAAGGVHGATALARSLLGPEVVRSGRESLTAALDRAVDNTLQPFMDALGTVDVGNGRELRLRAAEFRTRF